MIETSSLPVAEIKEGDKFGLLTVIGLRTRGVWDCRCVCTRTRLVPGTKLQIGAVDRCSSCHDYHVRVTEVMAQRSGYNAEQWKALETAWLLHLRACISTQIQPMGFMMFEKHHNEMAALPELPLDAEAVYESRDYSTHYDRAFEQDAVEDENAPPDCDDEDPEYFELRRRTRA